MRALVRCLGLLPLLFAVACTATMTPPPDFVVLQDPGEGWRAMTADKARLRVRDLTDPTPGNLAFWADTLRADLLQRGYVEDGAGEVKNAAGTTGRWHQFTANVQGERVGYLVAVWVIDPWWPLQDDFLRVAEFAAKDEVFKARVESVRAALATVNG